VKVDGVITGSDFSSKAWSVGGTNVTTTASRGASKEWAISTGAAVDTSEYSAKEYAIGTTVAAGSAKDWAVLAEDSAVTGSSYSALHHAAKSADSATASAASATAAAASAASVDFSIDDVTALAIALG
jgi:nucleoid-associated protein YgaU